MTQLDAQPTVAVGVLQNAERVRFRLNGDFIADDGERIVAGEYAVAAAGSLLQFGDGSMRELCLRPAADAASFTVRDVVIGVEFHWEREQDQAFRSGLRISCDGNGRLIVINDVPVEAYLASVISSEMSEAAHPELLKAHAIISRSWLLAQIAPWKQPRRKPSFAIQEAGGEKQMIRWYDQENHSAFDVCADDHCQRYQGITRAATAAAADAIRDTFGQVLVHGDELCDARFSKSCGGMTEAFNAAWEEVEKPYLPVQYDGESFPARFALPLRDEANAAAWIRGTPPAFCQTDDAHILSKILPDFDQETPDFYRWRVTIAQDELQALLERKLGVAFGFIRRLEAIERGGSGRIVRLRIAGERETMLIGKELEIRRALSPSHLYSSAFVVESDAAASQFTLIGAGWGHGVGLCQIGAALMAERGYTHQRILEHYYRGARLFELYER
jgi:SpoIID/LytB domain protein